MQTSPHVKYWQKKHLLNIYPVYTPKNNLANLFKGFKRIQIKHFGPQPERYCANQKLISSSKGAYNLISCLTWSHFRESQRWNSIMM